MTEPLAAELVLEMVAEGMGEEVGAFRERRRNSPLRAVAARLLRRYAGLNQWQVAEVLGMGTGAGVSWQAGRLAKLQGADRALRRRVQELERKLAQPLARKRPSP